MFPPIVTVGPVYGRGPHHWIHDLGPWLKKADRDAFDARFGTEEDCRDFLFAVRFRDGFRCSECAGDGWRWLDCKRLRCVRCRKKVSLTAGTILHGTRKPLSDWFRAAFLVVHRGTSARTLQRVIGLTYKVAWTWAHKLRRVMGLKTTLDGPVPPYNPCHERLAGRVLPNLRHRWFVNNGGFKFTADREGGLGTCCARLHRADWEDGAMSSPRLGALRLYPRVRDTRDELFRATMGSVSDKHLRAYMDEAEFRANHRSLDGIDRMTELVGRFGRTRPVTYREITHRTDRPPLWFLGRSATPC